MSQHLPDAPIFALAKIQAPRPRANLLERASLQQRLGRALMQSRLTLLRAPAGYGKTALLAQHLQQLGPEVVRAWISADDDPLPRFLACLTTALDSADLPWRVAPDALPMLALSERGLMAVAAELVNAMEGAQVTRGLIVIDDAHRITDPQVFELLTRLLERCPAHWGLVIATRVEPPLPLARLRAIDELAEFDQADLSFGLAEVRELLAASGEPVVDGRAEDLLARTGGWAAGLRLSLALGAQGSGTRPVPHRTQRHLFDYLATEVMAELPPRLVQFLLRSSVLPELTAARCAHVTGDVDAARWLDELERRGLFVSVLDSDEPTYRLHDLFRDFLEDRLLREQPQALPELLQRAAAQEGDVARAVEYLARAGAWVEAGRALAAAGPDLLMAGAGATVEQLMSRFPPSELEAQPELLLLRGVVAFIRYDWDALDQVTGRAARAFAAAGRTRDESVALAYHCAGAHHAGRKAEATAGLAALRERPLDDAARAVVHYVSAWDAFSRLSSREVTTNVSAMLDALERLPDLRLWLQCGNLSLFVGLPGMAAPLARFVSGVDRVGRDAPTPLRAAAYHVRCCLALSEARLDDAWHWLQRADEDCHWLGQPRLLVTDNALAHLVLHALRGEAEAANAVGERVWADMLQFASPSHRHAHGIDMLSMRARALWVLGDHQGLRAVHQLIQQVAHPHEWSTASGYRDLVQALVSLADGDAARAASLLQPLSEGEERHWFFLSAQARVLLADLDLQRGGVDAAAARLRPWLDAVHQGQASAGALLAGPAALGRLAAADWGPRLDARDKACLNTLQAALQRARSTAPGSGSDARPAGSLTSKVGVVVPAGAAPATDKAARRAGAAWREAALTEREIEVLALIAAGDSNKLIARAFDLSPHTVKRHVANILGKLGVVSRGQAAAWWVAHAPEDAG